MSDDAHKLSLKSLETDLVEDETEKKTETDPVIPDIEPLPRRTGKIMTTINLLNTLLGAGIIAMPNSMHSTGIIPSTILIFLVTLISHVATVMIFKLQLRFEVSGYDSLVNVVLGKLGEVIYSIFSLLFLIPNQLAYLIIGGDIITSWFDKANIDLRPLGYHALCILVYSLLLPIPITIPKDIRVISWISTITVICVVIYCAVMIYEATVYLKDESILPSNNYSLARIDLSIFSALAIYSETFNLPSISIPIIHHSEENYQARKIISRWAMGLCFFFVIFPSILGYLIFGENTNPNILLNFSPDDIAITVVRVAFFLIVNFSFPLVSKSVAGTWSELIYKENNSDMLVGAKRAIILVITCLIPLVIAMFLPQAKMALAIGSASGGFAVAFIFPAILWLKSTKKELKHYSNIGSILMAIFGIVFAIISTYFSVVEAIQVYKDL
ncbi:Transmembrane amino acid transporter protein [Tritrichomonas foetus]|uniref:Transmembrane amino acid transporter protein n=1 Tax=Tritrichomonas foetus TaxID=1144522 RepID=A0A1J4JR97_9EUKA|nr:Transmembrane amino acid transporter protein [Tritrichomonas foetus]|eukprot:OHT00030.1 Transmembrane amino acid transporter protein [Tritrichomonas foetus]